MICRKHEVSGPQIRINCAAFAFHLLLELSVYLFCVDVAFSGVVLEHPLD